MKIMYKEVHKRTLQANKPINFAFMPMNSTFLSPQNFLHNEIFSISANCLLSSMEKLNKIL